MKSILAIILLFFTCPVLAIQSVAILPFSNESDKQEIYWLGEGFAEALTEELMLKDAYIIQRLEKKKAYDELRLPYSNELSRATMLKIGETLSADYVVFGSYNLKAANLEAEAQIIRLSSAELSLPIKAAGTLDGLYEVQKKILEGLKQYFATEKLSFLTESQLENQKVPLHAYELYIKGLLEVAEAEKVKFFQRAIEVNPGYMQAIYRLSLTLFRMQKYRESNEVLKDGKFSGTFGARTNFIRGLNYYYGLDLESSLNQWNELWKTNPTAEISNNLAIILFRKNDLDRSIWHFGKAVELSPSTAVYHFNLGASYFQKQNYDSAITHLRHAIDLSARDYHAMYLLAKSAEKKNDPAVRKIMEFFHEILPGDLKGKFPDQNVSIATVLRPALLFLSKEEKQYQELSDRKLQSQLASYVKTYQTNARKLISDDHPDKAIIELKKGVSFARFDWNLHYLWGMALVKEKKVAEAVSELAFSIWCRDNTDSHVLLADLYRESGQYEHAKLQIQQTLALDPKNKQALEIWGQIWDKVSKTQ